MEQDLSRIIDALAGDLPASEVFRLIAESIAAPIAVLNADGGLESLNRAALDYFGLTLGELKDWAIAGVVHADDLPAVMEAMTRSVETGEPYDIEHRCRRADGAWRWFHVRALGLRDREGRILRWYTLLTDIHDRKLAEDAIRASERNLNLIINTIPAFAWSALPDGSAEFFNQHYLDYLGLTQEQAKGSGWTAAVHPDDLPGFAAAWQRIMASENGGEVEARLRRSDGQYRWFLFRGNPLRDESGNIVKWYGTNTDIDDRKAREAELRRAHDHLTEAQRLGKTGSFTSDLARDEHVWSDGFYRICEFERGSKVTIQRLQEIVHSEDLPSFQAAIERAMAGEDPEFIFRITTPRGVVKHLRGTAHRIEQITDRAVFVGAVQDVTASKVAEDALAKARSELAHVARVTSLGALTASIAHEVNNPLSGIVTNAGACLRMLAADPPDLEGARDTARRTIRDGRRASDVVTRLRALFANKAAVREPVDLNEATREVIALSRSELQRGGVILRLELSEGLPPVLGDRVQLQQVVLNLLLNAAEAMTEVDDRPRQLRVETERDEEDNVRLSVCDSGVGIDPQGENQLFDAFYTTKKGGMGMGLSVSRSIVESHCGQLWAAPNDGPGATFSFSIPRAPVE